MRHGCVRSRRSIAAWTKVHARFAAGFVGFPLAFVDSVSCSEVKFLIPDASTSDCDNVLTCKLPEGAGKDRPVVISANSQFSSPAKVHAVPAAAFAVPSACFVPALIAA